MSSDTAKAVVRRNTEEVQGGGNFEVFEELFADDFLDHTPQPNCTPDKAGARGLYHALRTAFPDFHADIHWQAADGELVTTFKTYHGTHRGDFLATPCSGAFGESTQRLSLSGYCISVEVREIFGALRFLSLIQSGQRFRVSCKLRRVIPCHSGLKAGAA